MTNQKNQNRKGNILKSLLSVAIAVAVLLGVAACDIEMRVGYRASFKVLDVPTNFRVDTINVIWDRDRNADRYEIIFTLDGFTYRRETKESRFQMLRESVLRRPRDGKYYVKVRAISDTTAYKSSEWSDVFVHEIETSQLPAPSIRTDGGRTLVWEEINVAQSFEVMVRSDLDDEFTTYNLANGSTSFIFNLNAPNAEWYEFKVRAIGDGKYYLTSDYSGAIYNTAQGRYRLNTPQNIRMEGSMMVWDRVYAADYYEIEDTLGNIKLTADNEPVYDCSINYFPTKIRAISQGQSFLESFYSDDITLYSVGDGTAQDPFIIHNYDEFRYIDYYETNPDLTRRYHYKLGLDFALESLPSYETELSNLTLFQTFGGELDGNGKTISNMMINFNQGAWAIFKNIRTGGVVKNLTISDFNLNIYEVPAADGEEFPWGLSGAIFAHNNFGTISGCTVKDGTIEAVDDAAGIASYNYGTITDCTVENTVLTGVKFGAAGISVNCFSGASVANSTVKNCTITAKDTAGGIVGLLESGATVSGCITEGGTLTSYTVKGEAGGIAGYSSGNIRNCTNSMAVSGKWVIGGIVGNSDGGSITGVANNGKISGTDSGSNSIGGIVGMAANTTIDGATNKGAISGAVAETVRQIVGQDRGGNTYNDTFSQGTVSVK